MKCPCAGPCRHCQTCWANGREHPEYASAGGYASHVASHREKPPTLRAAPARLLNRGERDYIRKRLEHVALVLAKELHLDPALVLESIPKIIRTPRERTVTVPIDDIPLTGPAVLVGMGRHSLP